MHIKETHRPLSRYRLTSLLACTLLFASFVLFLLVSLSLTIIKPIYLLVLRSTIQEREVLSLATELRFGVWGVCANGDAIFAPGLCIGPQLGYTIPSYLATDIGVSPSLLSIIHQALLLILILHPITCALSLLALLFSLFLASHLFSIFALIFAVVTALVGSVTLGADLALVLVARQELESINGTIFLEVGFGNGVWMILAGVVLQWLAVGALSARACYCLGVRRDTPVRIKFRRKSSNEDEVDSAVQTY
ncbi:hypothetical protein CVT26_011855 [Gymnopilus dilepis]|uniref:Pali-domain-containing protein n=1 Tax=Gymnopilus dilepis TaxID=231916 RepID=A0A409X0G3_9AGAR|nr:hypothetical protein CVT26_011855 [Gymnopilus dilepis]